MNHQLRFSAALPLRVIFLVSLLFSSVSLTAIDFTRVERGEKSELYAATETKGVFFSNDGGKNWRQRVEGLPKKKVWPFQNNDHRLITDIAVERKSGGRAAVTTSTGLYLSENDGLSWREIDLRYPVKPSNYLTSVAFDPKRDGRIYLGSSFNSLFVSENGGRSWTKLGDKLDVLHRGAGFYREISDIAVSETGRTVYLFNEFEKKIYRFIPDRGIVGSFSIPDTDGECRGITIYRGGALGEEGLEVHCTDVRLIYDPTRETWVKRPRLFLPSEEMESTVEPENEDERRLGKDFKKKKAIYLRAYHAYGDRIDRHLEFMKRHGFNALVVDVKDDWGKLTYETELDRHRRYGASRDLFDLRELIRKANEKGIYVIGRMVVFKDRVLYRVKNNEYAVWDSRTDTPWRHKVEQENPKTGEKKYVQREHWVDPFSEDVWDYNIAIARELQRFGIDEVQFDYIRFPSDGQVSTITYRHRRAGMKKTEAIESFLKKTRRSIHVPISVDLYGFNSWYRMGNWIGQDMGMLSHYVDVICPMFYPSHFHDVFLSEFGYIERAHRIYQEGTSRANHIVEGRSVIRPYVQAFLMGGELSMEKREYEEYLNRQIVGVYQGGGSGYTLWNNMNRYYMVNNRVNKLNRVEEKERETDT